MTARRGPNPWIYRDGTKFIKLWLLESRLLFPRTRWGGLEIRGVQRQIFGLAWELCAEVPISKKHVFYVLYSTVMANESFEDDEVDKMPWYIRSFLALSTDALLPTILLKVGVLWLKRTMGMGKG